jgi:3-deoxy-D-manno-octulosonic-acid transferase
MRLLYNIGIGAYTMLIHVAALFSGKAKLWVNGRKGIMGNVKASLAENEERIWFHSSSLGEFEQGRPVMEAYKKKFPERKILLTFFSPSGYEVRKNYAGADYVFYLPADFTYNARKFVQLVQPVAAVFVKYEFWYNYLNTLQKLRVPIYLISANFRENQLFFKKYGLWYRKMLKFFTHIFVQNVHSMELLKSIGIEQVTNAGDTRFDRVFEIAGAAKSILVAEKFAEGRKVLIAGSTWEKDEELLIQYINQSVNLRFILAPHEIEEINIKRIMSGIKKKVIRFSQATVDNVNDFDVLLIDNIGMLSSLYKYGQVAYIGGGFGKGIHNILEAATFGMPVLFGPNYYKFREAIDLIEKGGAFSISQFEELREKVDSLFAQEDLLRQVSTVSSQFVEEGRGATQKILAVL